MTHESANVLLVGSHPAMTAYSRATLVNAGWDTVSVVGPQAGLAAIERHPVDLLVLGGPVALRAREQLVAALRRRHPYALVVVPAGPDSVVHALEQAFGDPQ